MTNTSNICGFDISTGSLQDHLDLLNDRINRDAGCWVVTLNTEMLSRIADDEEYRQLIGSADLMVADGMPIVWTVNYKNRNTDHRMSGRTTGVDLVKALLNNDDPIAPYAVIGGVDPLTTIKQYDGAESQCKFLFTGIVDLSDEQTNLFVQELEQQQVKVVFLALGVPKQDQLAKKLRRLLPEIVIIGIGGTFEILSPSGRRAPDWMQKSGLEWFYRLMREPGRLWKRYLLNYPVGIKMLLLESFRG